MLQNEMWIPIWVDIVHFDQYQNGIPEISFFLQMDTKISQKWKILLIFDSSSLNITEVLFFHRLDIWNCLDIFDTHWKGERYFLFSISKFLLHIEFYRNFLFTLRYWTSRSNMTSVAKDRQTWNFEQFSNQPKENNRK